MMRSDGDDEPIREEDVKASDVLDERETEADDPREAAVREALERTEGS